LPLTSPRASYSFPGIFSVVVTSIRFLLLILDHAIRTTIKSSVWNTLIITSAEENEQYLPYSQYVLHAKAYKGNPRPAAEPCEDGFSSGFDQLDDICVQSDRSHCHDNEKFAQLF